MNKPKKTQSEFFSRCSLNIGSIGSLIIGFGPTIAGRTWHDLDYQWCQRERERERRKRGWASGGCLVYFTGRPCRGDVSSSSRPIGHDSCFIDSRVYTAWCGRGATSCPSFIDRSTLPGRLMADPFPSRRTGLSLVASALSAGKEEPARRMKRRRRGTDRGIRPINHDRPPQVREAFESRCRCGRSLRPRRGALITTESKRPASADEGQHNPLSCKNVCRNTQSVKISPRRRPRWARQTDKIAD